MINILLDQSDVAEALMATNKADVLEGYVIEMLRIDPPVQGIYREATAGETVGSTSINPGDLVYVDVSNASQNASPTVPSSPPNFSLPSRGVQLRNPR